MSEKPQPKGLFDPQILGPAASMRCASSTRAS